MIVDKQLITISFIVCESVANAWRNLRSLRITSKFSMHISESIIIINHLLDYRNNRSNSSFLKSYTTCSHYASIYTQPCHQSLVLWPRQPVRCGCSSQHLKTSNEAYQTSWIHSLSAARSRKRASRTREADANSSRLCLTTLWRRGERSVRRRWDRFEISYFWIRFFHLYAVTTWQWLLLTTTSDLQCDCSIATIFALIIESIER